MAACWMPKTLARVSYARSRLMRSNGRVPVVLVVAFERDAELHAAERTGGGLRGRVLFGRNGLG